MWGFFVTAGDAVTDVAPYPTSFLYTVTGWVVGLLVASIVPMDMYEGGVAIGTMCRYPYVGSVVLTDI
tara:strand:+ start:539 stop:742 length:204 start_codon:yes stop_codon:yes gene_type:complete